MKCIKSTFLIGCKKYHLAKKTAELFQNIYIINV